jgi:hypothetical protein
MAADISISGTTEFKYTNNTEEATDESAFGVESDVAIKFSATTDSGITTAMTYGFDDASGAADDMNASMTGDFGKILIVNGGADDGLVEGMTDVVNFASDGSDLAFGVGSGVGGGNSISYQLPTIVDGLTVALQHSNETDDENFGYGVTYDAGIATIRMASMDNNTTENTAASISATVAGVSFGYEQVKSSVVEGTTSETEFKGYGISYALADGIKLGYEAGDKEVGTTESSYTQIEVDYTVAPGITLSATSSEVDAATDISSLDINLALSF